MDLDIEMDVDDVPYTAAQIPEAYTNDIITGEEQEPGEVDEPYDDGLGGDPDKAVVPYKVHIRGLDTFTPDDVNAYVAGHCGSAGSFRIEWIDDSSANLVFHSESTAQEVLVALAAVEIADATQLPPLEPIRGKPFSQKPESVLQIRFAVGSDKKAAGAAQRSRFYLLHPEFDPEERRRQGGSTRDKYRSRDDRYRSSRDGGYRGDRRDSGRRDRRDRREDSEEEPFDVNLYDDDAGSLAKRVHRRPRSRDASPPKREKELFPDKLSGNGFRSRNRSASPMRDRDGDAWMDADPDEDARAAASLRSRERSRAIKERLAKENQSKELFPDKVSNKPKELFPEKRGGTKELFPSKLRGSFGGTAQMDQIRDTAISNAKLASRITPAPSAGGGFSIRGLASQRTDDQGIAIKGRGATVKELFPQKFGNAGKELFANKLEGRGRTIRQRAEDSFN